MRNRINKYNNLIIIIMGRWNNKKENTEKATVSSVTEKHGRWEPTEKFKEMEDNNYKLFAEMLIEKIKGFKGDWKKPWISENEVCSPRAIYGRPYNGMNAFLLMLHCARKGFKVPVFGTHDHYVALNYKNKDMKARVPEVDKDGKKLPFVHLLKGAKSFPVKLSTAIITDKETGKPIPYSEYMELSEEEQKNYDKRFFEKWYFVFNIDETNLKEARPEMYDKLVKACTTQKVAPEEKKEQIHIDELDYMINNNEWICPITSRKQDDAFYRITTNEIFLPERQQFIDAGDDGEDWYCTMTHEMTHSTGHSSLFNRFDKERTSTNEEDPHITSYGREELVAEIGSVLTLARFGYTKNLKEQSLAYLKGWISNLREKPEYIRHVMKDVKNAMGIMNAYINRAHEQIVSEENDNTKTVDDNQEVVGIDVDGDGMIEGNEIDKKSHGLGR